MKFSKKDLEQYMSQKIRKLKKEGYTGKQLIAIALSYRKKKLEGKDK